MHKLIIKATHFVTHLTAHFWQDRVTILTFLATDFPQSANYFHKTKQTTEQKKTDFFPLYQQVIQLMGIRGLSTN